MRIGYCAGLVASREDGLQFPRSIIQVPGHDQFVIADMGAWLPFKGRLLLFDPALAPGHRTKVLLESVDYPFGLAIGLDRKVYASTAETIFRFDPLARDPKETVETIVQGLPARDIKLPDGSKVAESVHLIKQFVFDKTGRLYVNGVVNGRRFTLASVAIEALRLSPSRSSIRITWPTELGAEYLVQFKNDLNTPGRVNTGFAVVGTSADSTIDIVPVESVQRFFRILRLH